MTEKGGHPGDFRAGVQKHLKIKRKKQKRGFPTKDFGNDEGGRCLA